MRGGPRYGVIPRLLLWVPHFPSDGFQMFYFKKPGMSGRRWSGDAGSYLSQHAGLNVERLGRRVLRN